MFTTYTGERVRLRQHNSREEGFELTRRLHLDLTPGWGPLWFPLPELKAGWDEDGWLGSEYLDFVVEELASGVAVGYMSIGTPQTLSFDTWIATYILPSARRQGYGVEAKRLALCCLFENYTLQRVSATTLMNHAAARRGLELCGFTLEGRLHGAYFSEGGGVDKVTYRIFREEWEGMEYRHRVRRGN